MSGLVWGWTPKQSAADELAVAAALNNAIALYPESIVYGTQACRAVIMSQSGRVRNSTYKQRLPLTVDLALKVARYMGAANGKWDSRWAFDEDSGNTVEGFYDVTDPWVTDRVKDLRWGSNLISAEYRNTKDLFYPAFQTSYNDSSSVFNSLFVVLAATQLTKIANHAWTRLVGNTRLKPQAFLDKSDQMITEKANGLFDDRFTITVSTVFTKADEERGYSWTTNIDIKSNVMKLVNSFTLSGQREDYVTA